MRRVIIYILFFSGMVMLFLMSGCRSVKTIGVVDTFRVKPHNDFFEAVEKRSLQFNTMSARISADIETKEKSFRSRIDLKLVKGRVLQLSVIPTLGIEAARIEFREDGVRVLDRINKLYADGSYAEIKGVLPVSFNFHNLQALFVNHIFFPGETNIHPDIYNEFDITNENARTKATAKDLMELIYTFIVDGEEKLLTTHVTDKDEEHELLWNYSDFIKVGGQIFPKTMDITIVTDKENAGKALLSFQDVKLNVSITTSFSVSSRYKHITLRQMMEILSNK